MELLEKVGLSHRMHNRLNMLSGGEQQRVAIAIAQQPEILEFLPWWNAPKEQRLDWLLNYETIENKSSVQRECAIEY